MAQTTGISIEYNAQGLPLFARIDLTKYGRMLMPFFQELGMSKEVAGYNQGYVKMINQAEADVKSGKGKKIALADLWN